MNTTTNNVENTSEEYSSKLADAFMNIDRVFKMVTEKKMVGTFVYDDNPLAVCGFSAYVFDGSAELGGGQGVQVSVVIKMPMLKIIGQDDVHSAIVRSIINNHLLDDDIAMRYRVYAIDDHECGKFLCDLSEDELEPIICMFGMVGTAPTLRKLEETEEDS